MLFRKQPAKLIYSVPNSYDIDALTVIQSSTIEEEPQVFASTSATISEDHVDIAYAVSHDETDRIPRELFVEKYHLVCFAFSMISYLFDFVSDIVLGVEHLRAGREISSFFILFFSLVPSVVLNIVSFAWICDDYSDVDKKDEVLQPKINIKRKREKKQAYSLHSILCLLQVGPVWWHYKALSYGLRFRKESDVARKRKWFTLMIAAERDATLLRLFEGFLESAPQLLVQGTLLADFIWITHAEGNGFDNLPTWVYLQLFTMSLSLFSLSWSITSQHRTIRMSRPDKVNIHPHETILQLIWRMLTIISRVLVLIMCITSYRLFALVLFVPHFLLSLLHVSALQRIETGTSSNLLDGGLVVVNALIHTFSPFNMADGATRLRYVTAYTIEAFEAVGIITLIYFDAAFTFPFKPIIAATTGVSYVLGILTMCLYFSCFHPNRRRHKRISTDIPSNAGV